MCDAAPAPIPTTFWQYIRSFGPGLVVVLTWLGAGDIVDMGVAGGNYGYALMWALVLAVFMRFLFVSLIAKYQLCNQHGHGVLDGLVMLHPLFAPVLFLAAVLMGHVYASYMTVGLGEACRNVFGGEAIWPWAVGCNLAALVLVFRPAYVFVEQVFKFFLAVLSISFLATAIWVGPNWQEVAAGLVRLEMPDPRGEYEPMLVILAMIGAVGGSLMNLVYPYFLDAKGWRTPDYRRVQLYDFLLAVVVMIVLNLSVWVLGAELLYARQLTIKETEDLPRLLSAVVGPAGRLLFYAGIFSAIFTSLVGHALGLACMGKHAWTRWRTPDAPLTQATEYRHSRMYLGIVIWVLVSPLIWTIPGGPGFVSFTLVINSAQVLLLPLIAGGLWCITASSRLIGPEYKNRWWENGVMALLFALAVWGAIGSGQSLWNYWNQL